MNINELVPDFSLPDLDGRIHRLSDYHGKIIVLNFWSCECPHSERADKEILSVLTQRQGDVVTLPIASNRSEDIEVVKKTAQERNLPMVLRDAESTVADLFGAQVTPHVFIIDREGILQYRGAVDDVNFRQRIPSRHFLREAVEALLSGSLPEISETPVYGCAIVREI